MKNSQLKLLKENEYSALEPKAWEKEKKFFVSSAGTEYQETVFKKEMLPRGSALITSSGKLKKEERSIQAIIHAAPGARSREWEEGLEFQPTLLGITRSIQNSIILAERFDYKSITFPFLGSGIFLDKVISPADETNSDEDKKNRKRALAEEIVKVAVNQMNPSKIKKITFVLWGEEDSQIFSDIISEMRSDAEKGQYSEEKKEFILLSNIEEEGLSSINGSIINWNQHKGDVIVNAANMEVQFGKGVSEVISGATGQKKEIDDEAKEKIKNYWQNEKEDETSTQIYMVSPEK